MVPSSALLVQVLTGPEAAVLDVEEPPVRAGLIGRAEGVDGVGFDATYGEAAPFLDAAPVLTGLSAPARLGPIVVGNLAGLMRLATRLKAPRHCKT